MVIITTGNAGWLFMGGILGCGISFVNPAQAGKFAPWRCDETARMAQLNCQQAKLPVILKATTSRIRTGKITCPHLKSSKIC